MCKQYGLNSYIVEDWYNNYRALQKNYQTLEGESSQGFRDINESNIQEVQTAIGELLLQLHPEGVIHVQGENVQSMVERDGICHISTQSLAHSPNLKQNTSSRFYVSTSQTEFSGGKSHRVFIDNLHQVSPESLVKMQVPGFSYEPTDTNRYILSPSGGLTAQEVLRYSRPNSHTDYHTRMVPVEASYDNLAEAWPYLIKEHPNYSEFHKQNVELAQQAKDVYVRMGEQDQVQFLQDILSHNGQEFYAQKVREYMEESHSLIQNQGDFSQIESSQFLLEWEDIQSDDSEYQSFAELQEFVEVLYPKTITYGENNQYTTSLEYNYNPEDGRGYQIKCKVSALDLFMNDPIMLPSLPEDVLKKLQQYGATKNSQKFDQCQFAIHVPLPGGPSNAINTIRYNPEDFINGGQISEEQIQKIRTSYETSRSYYCKLSEKKMVVEFESLQDSESLKEILGNSVTVWPDLGSQESKIMYPYLEIGTKFDYRKYSESHEEATKNTQESQVKASIQEKYNTHVNEITSTIIGLMQEIDTQSYSWPKLTHTTDILNRYLEGKWNLRPDLTKLKNIAVSELKSFDEMKEEIIQAFEDEKSFIENEEERNGRFEEIKADILSWINSGKTLESIQRTIELDQELDILEIVSLDDLSGDWIQIASTDLISQGKNLKAQVFVKIDQVNKERLSAQDISFYVDGWNGEEYSIGEFELERAPQSDSSVASGDELQDLANMFGSKSGNTKKNKRR